MADLPRITLDFSNTDEGGLVFARLARASATVAEGDVVVATDEEHECRATVVRVDGDLAYLELDTAAWTDVPSEPTRTGETYAGSYLRGIVTGAYVGASGEGNGTRTDKDSSRNLVTNP